MGCKKLTLKDYFILRTFSTNSYTYDNVNHILACTNPSTDEQPFVSYGNSSNLRTTKTYYPTTADAVAIGRLKKIVNPDDTITSYSYEYGTYSASPGAPGTFTPGTGDAFRTILMQLVTEKTTPPTNLEALFRASTPQII